MIEFILTLVVIVWSVVFFLRNSSNSVKVQEAKLQEQQTEVAESLPEPSKKPEKKVELSKVISVRQATIAAHKKKVHNLMINGGDLGQQPNGLPFGQKAVKKWPVLDLGYHPLMSVNSWEFSFKGLGPEGTEERQITLNELKEKVGVDGFTTDLHCVTTWSVLGMKWRGISFKKLVEYVKPNPNWKYLIQTGADGYEVNVWREDIEKTNAFIAFEYDGKPITREHGYVRLIIPNLFGWKASKLLIGLEFAELDRPGFWELRGSHPRGRIEFDERYDHEKAEVVDPAEVERRFEQFFNNEGVLDLRGLGLEEIPAKVFEEPYCHMVILQLDNNNITDLSKYPWEKLHIISRINLTNNLLTTIPPEFCVMPHLSELYLIRNELSSITPEIRNLTSLATLWVDENKLEELPVELSEISCLISITGNFNQIKALPKEFGKLKGLRCMCFRENKITYIPPEFYDLQGMDYFGIDATMTNVDAATIEEGTPFVLQALKEQFEKQQQTATL